MQLDAAHFNPKPFQKERGERLFAEFIMQGRFLMHEKHFCVICNLESQGIKIEGSSALVNKLSVFSVSMEQ